MGHPYQHLPQRNFWKRAVSGTEWSRIFEGERGKFTLTRSDAVATAGSCFAQRISGMLKAKGFAFGDFEPPHPLVPENEAKRLGYGVFSARYGNIYTIRQMRQLLGEAFGQIPAREKMVAAKDGRVLDLLRPTIAGGGFSARIEAQADRVHHLGAVRRMAQQASVLVFTLGLTEAWESEDDGTVFGIHPAVALGHGDHEPVRAVNFDYVACYNDLIGVLNLLRSVNPTIRLILTVSPVALAATHQDNHVLLATSYSKSVLRAVAGQAASQISFVDYFPSFEIFNAAQSFGQYLADDLREVNQRGVGVAMRCFEAMFMETGVAADSPPAPPAAAPSQPQPEPDPGRNLADVECDEIMNTLFSANRV